MGDFPVLDLTPLEQELVAAFPSGSLVDLRPEDPAPQDPTPDSAWGPERQVRGEVIAALLLGAVPPAAGRVSGVRLAGARITGRMDVGGGDLRHDFVLRDCFFDEPVNLARTTARSVDLAGSDFPGLDCSGVDLQGRLHLNGTVAAGEVSLRRSRIAGELSLNGSQLANPGGRALSADGLTVGSGIFCRDEFSASGEVRLAGAHVDGQVVLDGARLLNQDGYALIGDGLTVVGHVHCADGFQGGLSHFLSG